MSTTTTPRLRQRHLTMIALGGAIGAGLFIGTGAGIRAAGPGVLISFAFAACLASLVMLMLGEMAAAYPSSGALLVGSAVLTAVVLACAALRARQA